MTATSTRPAARPLPSLRSLSWRTEGAVTIGLFALYPVWWALGLGELIWPLAGLAMAVAMLRSGGAVGPRGFGLYVLFLVGASASGVMLLETADVLTWLIRLSQYASIGLIVPYVLTFRDRVDAAMVVRAIGMLWIATVVGGWLGLLLGEWGFASPLSWVLPGAIQANELVGEVVNPSFADGEEFLGYAVNRPKAPFTYTNDWGSAAGLLAPFAVLDARKGIGLSRRTARISLIASIIPVIVSVNRGLWVSLVIVAVYGAVMLAGRGQTRAVMQLLIAGLITLIFVAVTPLGDVFIDRVNAGHSDAQRSSLIVDTVAELPDSPILGFGAPRPVAEGGPPLGSHGQVWIVLFSYGLLGAVGYFGFLIAMYGRTALFKTEIGLWAHVAIFTSLIQATFYGHVPQQLAIIMVAIALGLIDRHDVDNARGVRRAVGTAGV